MKKYPNYLLCASAAIILGWSSFGCALDSDAEPAPFDETVESTNQAVTGHIQEGGGTRLPICYEGCVDYSSVNQTGWCCACKGFNSTYVRSSFSDNYYVCEGLWDK